MGWGALWDPNEHPRGWHGRFIKKWKVSDTLRRLFDGFSPRMFHTQGQASQYAFNAGHAKGAFTDLERTHLRRDFDEAQDHLRHGEMDPLTKTFDDTMQRHLQPTSEDLIATRTFGPQALGLRPDQLREGPGGITDFFGDVLTDKGYSAAHLGDTGSAGPGRITMTILTPKGTKVVFPGESPNDPGFFYNKNQPMLITRVDRDGKGGWSMFAVAEPEGAPSSGVAADLAPGHRGAGLSQEQRAARLAAPSTVGAPAAAPGAAPPAQAAVPPQPVEAPAVGRTPEQEAARVARAQAGRQARVNEGEAPVQAPEPTPNPRPAPPPPTSAPAAPAPTATTAGGPPPRNEPIHSPAVGGPASGSKSASEIGTPEPAAPEAPAAPAAPEPVDFRASVRDAGLKSPSAGKQRSEWNQAYLGIASGKKNPEDVLRELDSDIEHNKDRLVDDKAHGLESPPDLEENIKRQQELADHIEKTFNLPRTHQGPRPGEPSTEGSPIKHTNGPDEFLEPKVKEPGARAAKQTSGAPSKSKTGLTEAEQAGSGAGTAGVAKKAAAPKAAKAAPKPKKATKAELANMEEVGRATEPSAAPEVPVAEKGTGQHVGTPSEARAKVAKKAAAPAKSAPSPERAAAEGPGAAAPVAARKAAKAAAPAKVAAPKPKVNRAGPGGSSRPVATELDQRAADANLPATVMGLRAAAREKKIRGFSTMNKEQLTRALLGEEVVKTPKAGVIAPEKLIPHIEAAGTHNDARKLLEKHTLADLKEVAKQQGVDLKGKRTKDQVKDAILEGIRGKEGAAAGHTPVTSLADDVKHDKIDVPGTDPRIGEHLKEVGAGDDPAELRQHRDDLEKLSEELRADGKGHDARQAQRLADIMGMRAQVISGEEEGAPKAAAVKRGPSKAAQAAEAEKAHAAEGLGGTIADLRQTAKDEGVDLKGARTKEAIRERIRNKRNGVEEPKPATPAEKNAPRAPEPTAVEQETRQAARAAAVAQRDAERRAGLGPAREKAPALTDDQERELRNQRLADAARARAERAGLKEPAAAPTPTPTPAEDKKVYGTPKVPTRQHTPIKENPERKSEFDKAWDAAGIPEAPGSAGRSVKEIRGDIASGKITPDEGIRRLDNDIDLNKQDLAEVERDLRAPNLSEGEKSRLEGERKKLQDGVAGQEAASKFMRGHFGGEGDQPTGQEVMRTIKTERPDILDHVQDKDIADAARLLDLPEPEGNSVEEKAANLIQAVAERAGSKKQATRDLAKAMQRAATEERAAQRAEAKAKREAPFSPGGDKHLDAKAIAGDLEVGGGHIEDAQAELNAGKTPKAVAERLRHSADMMASASAIQNAKGANDTVEDAEHKRTRLEQSREAVAKLREFADRIEAAKRPRAAAKKAAPSAPTPAEDKAIKEAAEATGTPVEKVAAKVQAAKEANAEVEALGIPAPSADPEFARLHTRVVDRHTKAIDDAATSQELDKALRDMRGDLSLKDMRAILGPRGISGRSKEDLARKEMDRRFPEVGPPEGALAEAVTAPKAPRAPKAGKASEAQQIRDAASDEEAHAIAGKLRGAALDRALEEADLHPEGTTLAEERAMLVRHLRGDHSDHMARLTSLRDTADALSTVEQLSHDKASERAMLHRISTTSASPEIKESLSRAVRTGDSAKVQAEVDRVAREAGLTRTGPVVGQSTKFNPEEHESITPETNREHDVSVIRPGWATTVDGKKVQVTRAKVDRPTEGVASPPASKAERNAAERVSLQQLLGLNSEEEGRALLQDVHGTELEDLAYKALGVHPRGKGKTEDEVRASILKTVVSDRLKRQEAGTEGGRRIAGRTPEQRLEHAALLRKAVKTAPPPEPRPSKAAEEVRRQQEVADNLARLNAAKAVKAAPKAAAKVPTADELRAMPSRDTAHAAVADLRKAELMDLARELSLPGSGSKTIKELREGIVEATAGSVIDSKAIRRLESVRSSAPTAEEQRKIDESIIREAARFTGSGPHVTAGQFSDKPFREQTWGGQPKANDLRYHPDGAIGRALDSMGPDERLDVGGEPLHNVMGQIATDVNRGTITPNQALERYRALAARLPEGSRARRALQSAIEQIDAPARKPNLPEGTPDYLRKLADRLADIPIARKDITGTARPGELDQVEKLARELTDGQEKSRFVGMHGLEEMMKTRHESDNDAGRTQIIAAIKAALEEEAATRKKRG